MWEQRKKEIYSVSFESSVGGGGVNKVKSSFVAASFCWLDEPTTYSSD